MSHCARVLRYARRAPMSWLGVPTVVGKRIFGSVTGKRSDGLEHFSEEAFRHTERQFDGHHRPIPSVHSFQG